MTNIKTEKILFISHDATRTGAPFLLLHLLRWIKEYTDLSFHIMLKNKGALEAEFSAIAPTVTLCREISYGSGVIERLARIMGLKSIVKKQALKRLKKFFSDENICLIYSNTATNGEMLEWLRDLHVPIISHIHELEFWMRHKMTASELNQLFKNTDFFIAGAEIVKDNLIKKYSVPPEQIQLIHDFIPTSQHDKKLSENVEFNIHTTLGIPESSPIIGAAGTTDWRKGYDLFIQLARITYQNAPELNIHFVWVGGEKSGSIINELNHDLQHLGLENVVHFVGAQTNYLDYIASYDVFCLLSREDCFPLVVLEAAMHNKPIICFEKSGGACEFVENDAGFIVPYLDIQAMSESSLTLLRNSELRHNFGKRAAVKVKERHDIDYIAPQILGIIDKLAPIRQTNISTSATNIPKDN